MAFLYVSEFNRTNVEVGSAAQIALCPPVVEQKLAIGATSVQSTAFNASTHFVRLKSDAICSVAWGTNPVATDANMHLSANVEAYFGVLPGMKLAVITNI